MGKATENYTVRYAKGLLDVLGENVEDPKLEENLKRLERLGAMIQGEAKEFFENPTFTLEEKQTVLREMLKKVGAGKELERFFELVVSLGHMKFTEEIAKAFEEELFERRNQIQGKVRSAYPLSEKEINQLSVALEKATGKKVLLEVEEDRELIGGVVAHVGSVVYDASIQGFLNRLQQEL